MILQWNENFHIGSDTLTGVNYHDYQPPFPPTAKLDKLTIKVDPPQLSPEDIKKFQTTMDEKAKAEMIGSDSEMLNRHVIVLIHQ
jgi:arylsulfatase